MLVIMLDSNIKRIDRCFQERMSLITKLFGNKNKQLFEQTVIVYSNWCMDVKSQRKRNKNGISKESKIEGFQEIFNEGNFESLNEIKQFIFIDSDPDFQDTQESQYFHVCFCFFLFARFVKRVVFCIACVLVFLRKKNLCEFA